MNQRKEAADHGEEGVALDFRPASYWDAADPASAIVQNVKGQNRRSAARRLLTESDSEQPPSLDEDLIEDELDPSLRDELGRVHPSWMGGEYLPAYDVGEVEIARIVLASTTQDVISVRARRGNPDSPYLYRVVDEYEWTWSTSPAASQLPLSLGELIDLIDSAVLEDDEELTPPFLESLVLRQFDDSESPEDAARFVKVESAVYPQLGEYYAAHLKAFAREEYRRRQSEE